VKQETVWVLVKDGEIVDETNGPTQERVAWNYFPDTMEWPNWKAIEYAKKNGYNFARVAVIQKGWGVHRNDLVSSFSETLEEAERREGK